jgi:hypothetical protein
LLTTSYTFLQPFSTPKWSCFTWLAFKELFFLNYACSAVAPNLFLSTEMCDNASICPNAGTKCWKYCQLWSACANREPCTEETLCPLAT